MIRRQLPMAITLSAGLVVIGAWFLTSPALKHASAELLRWAVVVAGFSAGLGAANLCRIHLRRIFRPRGPVRDSLVLIVCLFGFVWLGMSHGTMSPSYRFIWNSLLQPLNATVFSLNAFWIASAAYRSFRLRSLEATLLALAAVTVMLGQVGLGDLLHGSLPALANWLMAVPATAGMRGIQIGGALGAIAMCFRVLLGLERSHYDG